MGELILLRPFVWYRLHAGSAQHSGAGALLISTRLRPGGFGTGLVI